MAFDAYALILSMLALGLAFQHLRLFPDGAAEVLNKVVLYVCLPAAVLLYAPRLALDRDVLAVAAVPWALLGATVLLVGPDEGLPVWTEGVAEELHPVLEILPLQRLARQMALDRGVDPDRPRGLSKVTRTR